MEKKLVFAVGWGLFWSLYAPSCGGSAGTAHPDGAVGIGASSPGGGGQNGPFGGAAGAAEPFGGEGGKAGHAGSAGETAPARGGEGGSVDGGTIDAPVSGGDSGQAPCSPKLFFAGAESVTPLPSMTLGAGVSSLSGTVANACVLTASEPSLQTTAGQEFSLFFARSTAELRRSLSLDVNVGFKTFVTNISAGARFLSTQETSSEDAYLVLAVDVRDKTDTMASATLTPDALRLLTKDPELFVLSCGDQFVSSITYGSSYKAVFKFSSLSEKAKDRLSVKLTASSGNWSTDGSFSKELAAATSRYQTQLYVSQSGGAFGDVPLDVSGLIAKASKFGRDGEPTSKSTPMQVATRPYYQTTGFPPGVRYPDLSGQLAELSKITGLRDKAKLARSDLSLRRVRLADRLGRAECAEDKAALDTSIDKLTDTIAQLERKAQSCMSAPLCGPDPDCLLAIDVPDLSMPPLKKAACGPSCAASADVTAMVDSFGNCTRCQFPARYGDPVGTSGATDGQIFPSTCRYMRRGADVQIRARSVMAGGVRPRCDPYHCGSNASIDVRLRALSSPVVSSCAENIGDSCRLSQTFSSFDDNNVGFTLTNNVVVGSAEASSAVTAFLHQEVCTASRGEGPNASMGCNYSLIEFEICDVDTGACSF